MSGVVCFSTASGEWAIEVEHTRRVLPAEGLIELPDPRPGVAGVLSAAEGEPPMPVLALLGAEAGSARHVLELEASGRRFGLLVDRVTSVLRPSQTSVSRAPDGQQEEIVCGVVMKPDGTALLVDAEALARRAGGAAWA